MAVETVPKAGQEDLVAGVRVRWTQVVSIPGDVMVNTLALTLGSIAQQVRSPLPTGQLEWPRQRDGVRVPQLRRHQALARELARLRPICPRHLEP